MAATIEKLVEKLTSEIDYTFLTDFFLIYRLFISPMALLKLIIVRFHWALIDDSPSRQIVRIRTFVTLRHWLLNYFEFDFMRSKDLRKTLGNHLNVLAKHTRVIKSMREQRIIKELRRYVQSLKTLHYRKQAQQKLEKQCRKEAERRHRLQARRSSVGRHGSSLSRPLSSNILFNNQGISSSNRSSFVHGPINRQSNESEVLTEILTVEFRSSDQSDEDDDVDSDSDDDDRDEDDLYNDEDDLYYDEEDDFCSRSGESSENNGFEPSSDNSIDDSEYDSVYSDSAHEDSCSKDNIPGQWRQRQPDIKCVKRDKEAFHSTIITHEDLAPECHLPSPAFSPQSGNPNQEGFGSLNSRLSPSADSSTAPRARTRRSRPGIPDFQAEYSNNTKTNPTPHGAGTGSRRSSRAKVQSRPLSTFQPLLSPPLSVPPLSPRGSLRSVEPYMNPPPRSVNSIEKKKPWSRYMSATVGHLSKMKRVFKSNSNRNTDRTVGDGVVRSNVSTSGRPRSERYWQGNLSDPEGEKVPYLLACPGMSIILSDERYGVFGKGNSRVKRGGASREDRRSGWSSDGDYSQYELTQHQRNQEMLSSEERELETRSNRESRIRSRRVQNFHEPKSQHKKVSTLANDRAHFDTEVHEIESFDHDSEFRKSIYSECERGQYFSIPTTLPRHGSEAVSAFDERAKISPLTDIEIAELCHCQGECECMATSKNANADDIITVPSTTNSARVPNLRRTTRRRSRDQRASWMTLSSTTSSMFGPLLNSNHLSPGQAIRQRGAFANVDRFVERFYNPQMDALTTKEAGLSQTGSDPQSMKELSLSRLEEPLSTQTEISKEQNASFSISNRPTSAMPNQTASDNIRRIYNIESTSIHPLAIIELQSIDPIPSGASTRALEPFVVNQEDSSRSLIQTQPSFIPLKDTKLRTKTTRSNSQPNLLTSLSNTENVAGKLQGGTTLPWQQHVNEQNLRVLDHCRHSRSSQAPSRPSSLRFKYPFMRRGSVDPPSIASHQDSKSSFSAQQQHGKLKIQVDPHVRSLSSSLSTTPSHFVSIVMRYSSELIAQQLCLIEREMLSQVQWYELVNAGWTKKAPATGQNQDENLPASTMSSNKESSRSSRSSREPSIQINEANLETIEDRKPNNVQATSGSIDDNQGGPSGICATNEHNSLHGVNQSEGTATPTLGISGSAGLKMESSNEQKPKAEDSVGTKRLIERFNLTCQWVTSEIVRTRDLHQRVKVVEKFIRIAHSHNVSRLNQTWALVRAQEMRIMEDLVEYTSPFHNWKHLRDDMKSIADEWGGSTNSNGGRRGKTATTMPEKAPSGSGGTTSLFFGKRHAKSIALGKLPKEDTSATGVGHNKPVTSPSARASKASSIAHTKDKETPIEKFAQQEKEGAKVDQPKGCIPFLGLYLSDLVFNAELPSYIERPSKSKKYANEQSSSTKHKCMQLDARAQPGPPLSSGSATLSKAETTSATKHALSTASSSLQQTESSWPLINIHKHRTTATIIKRILTFKTLASRYPFEQDPDVYPLLMAIQGLDPAEISRLSSIYEEKEKESDIRRS
ncbi:hypothetical protein FBU30_002625 [Linnemannia zychae]|nr:hypothetical protein FBU30_002625 [Linnemannia zychae]